MSYQIEVRQMAPRYLAGVEFRCSADAMPEHLEDAFEATVMYLESIGVQPAPPPVARYTPPQDGTFLVAAGFYVSSPVEGDGHVVGIELPTSETVHTTHTGSYEELPQAYDAIFAWMKEHGREPARFMWEEYHTTSATPEQARTEVYWPVKQS